MNTDLLTFFSVKRSRDVIRIYEVGPPGNPDTQVLVYSPEKVDLPSQTAKGMLSDGEYKDFLKEIRTNLAPRGGMIAQVSSHNGFVQAVFFPVKAQGYTPPSRMLRLGPASSPRFEELPQKADLPVGDHLVVPVSAEAETRLEVFHEVVDGFPSDLALSILNVIRRPSLEWRIERLEKHARQAPATWVEEQRSSGRRETFLEKLYRWLMWRLPVGAVAGAVAVTLLLANGAVAGYHRLFGDEPETEGADETPGGTGFETPASPPANTPPRRPDPAEQPPAGSGGNGPTAPAEGEANVPSPLNELFKTLAASENEAIKTLYEKHLADPQGQIPGWGLAKLEALHLGIIDPDDPVLSDPTEWTAVKDIYRSERGKEALASKKEASALLAWGSCTYFGKPELPATKNNTNPPLAFGTESDCRKLNLEDVRVGYQDLTDWVKEQKK